MAKPQYHSFDNLNLNPFEEPKDNSKELMENLALIDSRDLRSKYSGAQDPINLAFQTFEDLPLKTLAKDFVKEGICDLICVVKDFLRN